MSAAGNKRSGAEESVETRVEGMHFAKKNDVE
jgi:hypothetical protein